jgi:FtsZ-interacting cell division protein ZipA
MSTTELRLILLAIGVPFIAGMWWWERRRPRQASGSAADRPTRGEHGADTPAVRRMEPSISLPTMRAREAGPPHDLPVFDLPEGAEPELAAGPAPEAPTDEVATLRPADLATEAPSPAAAQAEEGFDYVPKAEPPAARQAAPAAVPPREVLPELPGAAAPIVEWPPDDKRRILALRLVAPPERFAGRLLRQALAAEGFVLGRFAIFHKPDAQRRAVLSAASLSRPGTFDAETMDSQHFGGLSLFAVLPGPKSPSQAFDELVSASRALNERLQGLLQDEQGSPLTPARIAQLREKAAESTL